MQRSTRRRDAHGRGGQAGPGGRLRCRTLALQAPPAETPAAKGAAIGRGLYRLGSAACCNASMYYGAAEGTPGGIAGDT